MDITLTPETEALIRQKVANGGYESAAEVIAAGVLLLDERDRFEYLRSLLLEAEQQTLAGEVLEWTPELQRRLRQEAEEMVRLGIPPDPDVCPLNVFDQPPEQGWSAPVAPLSRTERGES